MIDATLEQLSICVSTKISTFFLSSLSTSLVFLNLAGGKKLTSSPRDDFAAKLFHEAIS